MYAAQDGHTKVVELLLQYEASVDLKLRVSEWPRVAALLPTVNCSHFLFGVLISHSAFIYETVVWVQSCKVFQQLCSCSETRSIV